MRRDYETLLRDVQSQNTSTSSLAANELAQRSRDDASSFPFLRVVSSLSDRELSAVRASQTEGDEEDRLAEALCQVRLRIGKEWISRDGTRESLPDNLASLADRVLCLRAVARLESSLDLSADRSELSTVLAQASTGQTAVIAAFWAETEVSNGGFLQFFSNPSGVLAPELIQGLGLIDAADYIPVVRGALGVVKWHDLDDRPSESVLRTIVEDESNRDMDRWDEAFHELNRRRPLISLAAAYVRSHPDDFFRSRSAR